MALGALTKLDLGVLISFVALILMIARNNNKRFKEKADKAELDKLEKNAKLDMIDLKCEMSKEIDLKIAPIHEINDNLKYIRLRLDMHIENEISKNKRNK